MSPRVLVVDDESSILITFRAILERDGFEVETAGSAQQATQKLEAAIFQLVISDLRMETDQAGCEVIRTAKAQAYGPVAVLLTAYPPPETEWKSWGADALFEKPVNITAMAGRLKVLVERRNKQTSPPKI
jgi:DNA-binding NtrC family response regulator